MEWKKKLVRLTIRGPNNINWGLIDGLKLHDTATTVREEDELSQSKEGENIRHNISREIIN